MPSGGCSKSGPLGLDFLLRIAIGSGQSAHLVFEELEVFPEALPGQVAKLFIDLAGSAELKHFL